MMTLNLQRFQTIFFLKRIFSLAEEKMLACLSMRLKLNLLIPKNVRYKRIEGLKISVGLFVAKKKKGKEIQTKRVKDPVSDRREAIKFPFSVL